MPVPIKIHKNDGNVEVASVCVVKEGLVEGCPGDSVVPLVSMMMKGMLFDIITLLDRHSRNSRNDFRLCITFMTYHQNSRDFVLDVSQTLSRSLPHSPI